MGVQYLDVKVDKDGHEERTWTPQIVGNLRGVSVIDFKTVTGPLFKVEKIIECLGQVRLDRDAGIDNLKRWSETLGSLDSVEETAVKAEDAFNAFTQPDNLQLLLLINSKPEVRSEVAQLVLKCDGQKASKTDSKHFAEDYYATLRSARKNDGMRIL